MKLLLDTHAWLWWLSDNPRLSLRTQGIIEDPSNDILVSVASLWEIVIKVRVGKLQVDINAAERAIVAERFNRLAITPAHLAALSVLPAHHRDPFDHLLIAQARVEGAILVSDDDQLSAYEVTIIRCGR